MSRNPVKRTLSRIALVAMASAAAVAFAQSPQPRPAPAYVTEPAASIAAGAPQDEQLVAIAQGLNAEAALKGSKLTVMRENENVVLLTGVTVTRDQMKRALEIASQHAGEGMVGNAITSEELVVNTGEPGPAPTQAPA